MMTELAETPMENAENPPLQCSFCKLDHAQVEWLIAGPDNINICSSCVDLCVEILAEKRGKPVQNAKSSPLVNSVRKFFNM